MRRQRSRTGTLLAGIYLLASAAALAFMLYVRISDPMHSEFSGLFLVILTLPWSLLSVLLIDSIGIMDTFGLIAPLVALLFCVAINAGILYWVGRGIDGGGTKREI